MTWRALARSHRTLGVLVAAVGLLPVSVWLVRGVISGPDADPGGRILHSLAAAAQALPNDAHIIYRKDLEPKWDSCDGRPGTFGWDNVVVQVHFESRRPTDAVVQGADQTFRRLGWNPDYVNHQTTFIQVGWTRRLDNGSIATAQLSNPDQTAATPRWDLFVTSPPVGHQSSGC